MAKMVLGIGTTMSPLVSLQPEDWSEFLINDRNSKAIGLSDGRMVSYDQLRAENGDKFADEVTPEKFAAHHAWAQQALNRLSDDITAADPGVVVVIADDNGELFDETNMPLVAIYHGAELCNYEERRTAGSIARTDGPPQALPRWRRDMFNCQSIPPERHYPGAPEFANSLIAGLVKQEIDVARVSAPAPETKRGAGFSFGFVINRLFKGRAIPVVPLLLNAGHPPNIPTTLRSYRIGQALRAAIEGSPMDLRVAVIATGGLSHIALNESLDRKALAAMIERDVDTLAKLPEAELRGAHQIRNWTAMVGASDRLDHRWAEYRPVRRTAAGTAIGMTFSAWF